MPIVTFKDLCIDATDVPTIVGFWSRVLHLRGEVFDDDGSGILRGDSPSQTVWINPVPEARTVKGRVHLDVVAPALDDFATLPHVTAEGEFGWTVLADPEGNEFCVFEPRLVQLPVAE